MDNRECLGRVAASRCPVRPWPCRGSARGAGRCHVQNGRWAGWPCGRSRIRASTIARRRAWRPGTGRRCRAMRSGAPAADRPDPVALLEEQDATREPDLVPVRHGRMMVSPFTFYRGAAKIMAADLKDTPVAGLGAQLCGDAHLSNFGAFASPERILLFDLNDFDETLPGPFEYDVKRMAASFTIAARNNGFSKADTRAATLASVRAYREAMAAFAQMRTMDIWYAHLDEDELMAGIRSAVAGTAKQEKGGEAGQAGEEAGEGAEEAGEAGGEAGEGGEGGGEGGEDGGEAGGEDPARRRTPATACRRCPSSASWSTGSTGSSASRRSSSRRVTWPPPTGCPRSRSCRRSASSSAPTGPPCKTTGASCWSASRSWTRPARSSASAASAPGRSSSCSRDATRRIRCSCRSRRRRHRCLSRTCARAGTGSTASGWCRGSG